MERGDLNKRDVAVDLSITKIDQEQRKAYGWVSIVETSDGEPIIDGDGHVIPIGVLEKAVHNAFTADSGSGKGGDLHERRGIIDVIESAVVTAEKRAAEGSPFASDGPAGWWAGFQVNDDATWAMVKGGQRPELSLRGSGAGVELSKRNGCDGKRAAQVLITKIDLNKLEWFSTVDKGASGDDKPEHRPRIVLWKRSQEHTTMTVADLIKAHKKDTETVEKIKQLDLAKAMTPKLLEILGKLKPEEQAAVLQAIEGGSPAPKQEPEPASAPEMSDEAKKQFEMQQRELTKRDKDIAELRKRIDEQNDAMVTVELKKRLESGGDMAFLPVDGDDLIEMIKSARKGQLSSEQAKDFEELLVKLSKAMRTSPQLRVLGTAADPDASDGAAGEVLALAKKLKEKNPTMSDAAARAKVYESNPELYNRMRAEAAE